MNLKVRSIDVGFGMTKYITASDGARIDCAHFPSLSFYSPVESPVEGLGGRRKTVCVPVGELYFEVGPEVELAAERFRARQLHDGYTETPEYRAFMAGALHYMREDVIDLLVVGLPVAQFMARRAALEKSMTGTFEVGRRRQVVARMSHSANRGVSDILRTVARAIGAEIGEECRDFEAIDQALCAGRPLSAAAVRAAGRSVAGATCSAEQPTRGRPSDSLRCTLNRFNSQQNGAIYGSAMRATRLT